VISDPDGLLSLLEMHGAELHALFTRLTMRADVAEDLLQELFVKLRRSDRFVHANNRKAYLFRTAIHLAFDWRRAQRHTEPLCAEPAAAEKSSPLDRLIDAEELKQVLDAMEYLGERGRQMLIQHYLQHLDYAEIAQQVGKTEHQVRGLCSKALGQLRTLLRTATSEPKNGGTRP